MTLTSCVGTYNFCQVFETQLVNQKGLDKDKSGVYRFEDEHCTMKYYFWSNCGTAGFAMYNKTDQIIYVDLAKSFFVRNGIAYDLYRGREWSESASIALSSMSQYQESYSASIAASVGGIVQPTMLDRDIITATASVNKSVNKGAVAGKTIASSKSSSVTYKENPIVAIPPHSYKYIETYPIIKKMLLSCELQPYPTNNSTLTFNEDNTPLKFTNYISYYTDKNSDIISVSNSFYVSRITNYAEPTIMKYVEREAPCENLKDILQYASEIGTGIKIYDKKINENICEFGTSFYYTYEKKSKKALYKVKDKKQYIYNEKYGAYTIQGQGGQ